MDLQTALQGIPKAERRQRRGADRPRRPEARRRPPRGRVLGRDETAPRSGAGPGAPAAGPVPRRATTGLDPQSRTALWEESHGWWRRGNDGLPHHPVPRGGGCPRRPGRDHRSRRSRRRGDPGEAEGRDRPADRRGRPLDGNEFAAISDVLGAIRRARARGARASASSVRASTTWRR